MLRKSAYPAPLAAFIVLCAASPLGCLGANASEDRQLDQMRKEIAATQSDGDKFEEHLGKRANAPAAPRESHPGEPREVLLPSVLVTGAPSRQVATPDLPIVHLKPDEAVGRTAAAGADRPQILSFTNANIGAALASHPAPRSSIKRHVGDASPAHKTRAESDDAPAAPRQAAPRQAAPEARPPEARPPTDEDDEHLAPNDEDNEHLAPDDEDNEHLVGGDQR